MIVRDRKVSIGKGRREFRLKKRQKKIDVDRQRMKD